MARVLYENNCVSTLAKAITASSTSMTISDINGNWPEITSASPNFFFVTLVNPNNNDTEIVKVTRCNPDTGLMNITRAQDGTKAKSFPISTKVEMRITKSFFDAYLGAAAFVPFFAFRLEHPAGLPAGWIHCDGSAYEKTSKAGEALMSLPTYTKSQWKLVETTTTITAPNFYDNSTSKPYFVIPGREAGVKDSEEIKIKVKVPKEGGTTEEELVVYTLNTVQMTPALFVGV
jgi:hypothetical protein|nr:MAG TPA: tail fiber protein [Caudoviricetes sp.]